MSATFPDQDPGDETRAATDDERTVTWVEERFRGLGFNEFQAFELAERKADWHQARRLLARGCDLNTAFDLLT